MYLRGGECPMLSSGVVQELRSRGIHTLLAFLSRDAETLSHACSLSYQEVVSVKKLLAAKYAALPAPVGELLNSLPADRLPLGCETLDGVLCGGLAAGELVELCGASAVGKTQLCLCASVSAICAGARVIYADTTGEFSAPSCRRLLRHRGVPASERAKLLSRLRVARCSSAQELLSLLETVRCKRRLRGKLRLLVVDSLAAVTAPLLAAPDFLGFSILNALSTALKSLAAENQMTALVTNHSLQGEPRPALGLAWLSAPHVRLMLRRQVLPSCRSGAQLKLPGPRREALVVRNVGGSCGNSAEFVLTKAGPRSVDEQEVHQEVLKNRVKSLANVSS